MIYAIVVGIRMVDRRPISILLGLLAILSAGCQPVAMGVSTIIPNNILPPTISPESLPTDIPIILSIPTNIPIRIDTPTPGSPLNAAPASGPFKMVIPIDEVLSGTVESLVSAADGTVWLITEQEIAKIIDTTLTVYLTGLAGKMAEIDSAGRVWVVNEDATQISAWNGQAWTIYGVDSGWTPLADVTYQYLRGGRSDLLGRVWFATSQDVRAFDGNLWTVYTPQEMGMGPSKYDDLMTGFEVTVLRSGMVGVAECDWGGPGPFGGRGVRWLDKGAWQGASSPVASGCASAIAEDSVGQVWMGVDNNLWRYDPVADAWNGFTMPEPPIAGMRFGFIDSLAVDSYNNIWTILVLCGGASCYGNCVLYNFRDELWTQVGEVGEYDAGYWGPIFGGDGMPWLYWDGGIYRIRGNSPELVSPLTSRFSAIDNRGRLWLVAPDKGRDMLWVLDETKDK
jgi:hypothetical protein